MSKMSIKSPKLHAIACAASLLAASMSAQAGVSVDSIVAQGQYTLGSDPSVNFLQSGSPSVDVVAFATSGGNSAVFHSYGSVDGNFGSRSSGLGVYDVTSYFRITETITNSTAFAQNATFNFFITPGMVYNEIGSALTGSSYVSSGLSFDIKRNESTIWGSAATLTSNAVGTIFSATGDTALYSGSAAYYSVQGVNRSVDLGVINAGQSITLSYELSSFAKGESTSGPDRLVPEVTYHVPGQWVDPCSECGYGYGGVAEYVPAHDVTVPAYTVPGAFSGSHASSGDPFDIRFGDTKPSFTGQPIGALPFGSNVTFTSAVPEPSELALMLAGMGIVGWATRRRVKAVV